MQGEDERREDNTAGEEETTLTTSTQVSYWCFYLDIIIVKFKHRVIFTTTKFLFGSVRSELKGSQILFILLFVSFSFSLSSLSILCPTDGA